MNARRPSAPRSSRAPSGRPDARKTSRESPKAKGTSSKGSGASSSGLKKPGKRSGVQIRTADDRTFSFSWRFLVGVLVAATAFVLVAPTLNLYFQQMEQVRTLNEQITAAQERNAQLEREIAMWDDADFVRSQARDRLGFVLPGEQSWVVVDPEAIIGEEAQEAYQEEMGYIAPIGPWYLEIWTSIETAGGTEPADGGRQMMVVEQEDE